jgi:multicomponent Na+:H+ antiporter subunit C
VTTILAIAAGVLCGCGAYLALSRQLSRVIIGIGLLGHGVNVLLLMAGGDGGDPPFVDGNTSAAERAQFADPLPQAFILTAIVISFGVIAFLLALAHRSWHLTADDEVEDDIEDRRIAGASDEAAEQRDRP